MHLSKTQRLKILRENAGLSQKDVADALDMTKSGYSLIENGKTKLNESHLKTLQNKFGFDINYIIQGDSDDINLDASVLDLLKMENTTLKSQVKQLMELVAELTATVKLLSNKMGKLEGNCINYAATKGKLISIGAESVTLAA